jgi:hypothetical protein
LDLRGADDHLQSGFWLRGGLLSSGRCGGLSGGHLINSGAPLVASYTSGVKFSMGTATGISLPSASAPVNEKTNAFSVI